MNINNEETDYTNWTLKDFKKHLTLKQQMFCREYVIDRNATRSAKKAGYSKKTAKQIAAENLTKPYLAAFIDYLNHNIEEALGLSKTMIIKEHMKIAMSSIAHFHNTWITRKEFETLTDDQKACIQEIDSKVIKKSDPVTGEMKYTAYVKIKLYDKTKALDSISKLMGYDAPVKIDQNVRILSFSELVEKAAEKERELKKQNGTETKN